MSNETKTPSLFQREGCTIYVLHGDPPRNRWWATVQTSNPVRDAGLLECESVAKLLQSAPALYAALEQCANTFGPLLAEVELDPQDNPARMALAEAWRVLAVARGEKAEETR